MFQLPNERKTFFMRSRDKKTNGLNEAVILLAIVALTHITNVEGKPARNRELRDILEFFRKAGDAVRKVGENALKVLIPNVMKTEFIPGTTPQGQQATQPKGPRIPLNAISEDAPKPVIPNKRRSLAKSERDIGEKRVANFLIALLRKPFRKAKDSNKKLLKKVHLDSREFKRWSDGEKEPKILKNLLTEIVCRKLC